MYISPILGYLARLSPVVNMRAAKLVENFPAGLFDKYC
jgi:hypothetical protein